MDNHTNEEALVEPLPTKLYCPVPLKPMCKPLSPYDTIDEFLPGLLSFSQLMHQFGLTSHLLLQNPTAFSSYLPSSNDCASAALPEGLRLEAEPVSIACPSCAQCFTSSKGMRQHVGKVHAAELKSTVCEVCARCFKNKYALKFHHKQVHLKQTRVSCPACSKVLYNKYILSKHIKAQHSH
jgi:hypothetical protein